MLRSIESLLLYAALVSINVGWSQRHAATQRYAAPLRVACYADQQWACQRSVKQRRSALLRTVVTPP